MTALTTAHTQVLTNEQDIHRAGRQAFLGITKDWGLTIDEQRTLLGGSLALRL